MKALGLPSDKRFLSDEEIKQSIMSIYDKFGFISYDLIKEYCVTTPNTVINRFGSISEVAGILNIPVDREKMISLYAKKCLVITGKIIKERPHLEKTFSWLINPKTGKYLRIDAYYPSLKLALEFDHKQHNSYISYFHKSEQEFEYCKERDEIKNSLLRENGISLIRIYSSDNEESVVGKINSFLAKGQVISA